MPLFFFDVHDGQLCFTDKLGQNALTREHAKSIALAMLPELIGTTEVPQDRRQLKVEVRDESGALMLTTCLCISSKWCD